MATRIRDFDWVTTPLGPIEGWSPALRTIVDLMLASDVVMSVMWGQQAIQIFNDAYANAVAERHPAALGGSALETFGDFRPIFEPLFQRAMSGSTSTLQNLRYQFPTSHQSLGEVWFDLTYTPIRTGGSTVAGVLAILSDATVRVRAEQVLQQGEERQAFLLALSDALRSLDDAAEIQEAACHLLGEYLGTDRTYYVEIDDELDSLLSCATTFAAMRRAWPEATLSIRSVRCSGHSGVDSRSRVTMQPWIPASATSIGLPASSARSGPS